MRGCVAAALLIFSACATPSASQGGAQFKNTGPSSVASPEALFAVCWPQDALSASRITLTFQGDDAVFEARDGATNSTGRCIREIATSVVWPKRPASLELAPPSQPIDGWAALAWVKLLSSSRFTAERGVLDPAARIAACAAKGGVLNAATSYIVRPGQTVRVVPTVLTDAERCAEAVLGATVWPSTRELYFSFDGVKGAPEPSGDVTPYLVPDVASGAPLDPQAVRDTMQLAGEKVGACWEAALARRPELHGARTFRFTVGDDGRVTRAWVSTTSGAAETAADALLDACLHGVITGARFPPRAGDGFYTWVFATR